MTKTYVNLETHEEVTLEYVGQDTVLIRGGDIVSTEDFERTHALYDESIGSVESLKENYDSAISILGGFLK